MPWTLFAASFGFLMVSLDATIVNVALPALGRQLDAGLTRPQWVVDGSPPLMFAAFQLIGGSLGDRMGARRAFTVGLGLFVLASVACGLAPSAEVLIVAPASCRGWAPPCSCPRRSRCSGPRIRTPPRGPGGRCVGGVGWRAVAPPRWPRRADGPTGPAARTVVVLALSGLTFGLIEGAHLGWTSPAVLGALVAAVAGGTFFVRWEGRVPEPTLPTRLFRHPVFTSASIAGVVQNFAYCGIVFPLSLFLQNERGDSALVTGPIFLPMSIAAMASNPLGGRLTGLLGPRLPMTGGQLVFAGGLLALLFAGPDAPTWAIWPATVPVGVGGGAVVPAMASAVLEAVEPEYAGVASAELNTARQAGGAVGVALSGTLVAGTSCRDCGCRSRSRRPHWSSARW